MEIVPFLKKWFSSLNCAVLFTIIGDRFYFDFVELGKRAKFVRMHWVGIVKFDGCV